MRGLDQSVHFEYFDANEKECQLFNSFLFFPPFVG